MTYKFLQLSHRQQRVERNSNTFGQLERKGRRDADQRELLHKDREVREHVRKDDSDIVSISTKLQRATDGITKFGRARLAELEGRTRVTEGTRR